MKKQLIILTSLIALSLLLSNSVEISQKYLALNQFSNSETDFQLFQKISYLNYLIPAIWISYAVYLFNEFKKTIPRQN